MHTGHTVRTGTYVCCLAVPCQLLCCRQAGRLSIVDYNAALVWSPELHALAVAGNRTFSSNFLRGPRFHRRENGICVPCWWSRRFLNICTKTWIQRQIQNSFVLSSVPRSEEHPHEQKRRESSAIESETREHATLSTSCPWPARAPKFLHTDPGVATSPNRQASRST